MTKFVPLVIIACAIAATAVTFVPSRAQNSSTAKAGTSSDPAALPDQELGRRFLVKPEDLPPPRTGPIVSNRPLTLAYHGQTPRVPEGFKATLFASGLQHPRRLLVLPNGDVLVAEAHFLRRAESADRTGQHDRRALMRLRDGCGAEG